MRRVVVVATGVLACVVLAPVVYGVYNELGSVGSLSPGWLGLALVFVWLQLAANWELQRVLLRTQRWLDVAAPQLAGNASSHLLPGGGAVGAGLHTRLLTSAGFPTTAAVATLGTLSAVGLMTTYVIMPVLVIPASVVGGGPVDSALVRGLLLLAGGLSVVIAGAVLLVRRDAAWRPVAGLVARLGSIVRRPVDRDALYRRLLRERDDIVAATRGRLVWVLGLDLMRAGGDYIALYCATRAVGVALSPLAVFVAFVISNLAGLIPLTPGGIGFVEVGLTGALVVAGAANAQARLAVASYRLAATWIPCLAAVPVYVAFRRRHEHNHQAGPPRTRPRLSPARCSQGAHALNRVRTSR